MKRKIAKYALLFFVIFTACKKEQQEDQGLSPEDGEEFSGGTSTITTINSNSFSRPSPAISAYEVLDFEVGDGFFTQAWVSAPATTTARDGLGPVFNARSCGTCHSRDGRGRAPEFFGEEQTGYLIRISQPGSNANNGPLADPIYGGQIQDLALNGIDAEARFEINYTALNGEYDDGNSYSLRKPEIVIRETNYGALHNQVMYSPRVAPHMVGLGLLENVPDETFLSFVDENDSDNDGISGRANYVYDAALDQNVLGKFGWKANQPNLVQQSAGAFLGDMGITTSLFPDENCPVGLNCDTIPNGSTPECTDETLDFVVFYVRTLAVPAQRDVGDQDVLKGKQLFFDLECEKCHRQKMETGSDSPIDALNNQTIYPYTDLLLHDMGEGLADNRPDFLASGTEWRTPPLWGIGLFETVNGHTNYLHDGRARNIEEAVLWHGGEAQSSVTQFKALGMEERNQLLKFLNSL